MTVTPLPAGIAAGATSNVPALTSVAPPYVLAPASASIPAPFFVRPDVPDTTPGRVTAAFAPTLNVPGLFTTADPSVSPATPLVTFGPADTFSVNAPAPLIAFSAWVTPGPAV